MSVPQLLSLSFQTTTPRAMILTGGDAQVLGSAFGTAATYNVSNCAQARIVQFKGALYAFAQNAVYRSTDLGQNWTIVLTPASIAVASPAKQIYVVQLSGEAHLCIAWCEAGGQVRLARSIDGTAWTQAGPFSVSFGSLPYIHGDFIDSGVVYVFSGGADYPYYAMFNFNSLTAARAATSFVALYSVSQMNGPEFVSYQGSIYFILGTGSGAGATARLIRVNGALNQQVSTIALPLPAGLSYGRDYRNAVFTDGTNIYGILNGGDVSVATTRCVRFNSSFVATDITNTVLPTAMSSTSLTIYARTRSLVDCVSDPANPQIYIWHCPLTTVAADDFTPWVIYRWVNDATQLEFLDSGPSYQVAIPFVKTTEGSNFYTTSDGEFSSHAEIIDKVTTNNGTAIRITFLLYSTNGTTLLDVRGYYGAQTDPWASNLATLSAPSSGTLVGSVIENIVGDNGVTSYSVTWESMADGIGNGDKYKFVLHTEFA